MHARQLKLYLLVLVLMAVVVITALGGGLFGQSGAWFTQWQHQAFGQLCHQIPERSFWMSGQPMAICSRCLGIYSGFLAGWLLLPLMSFMQAESEFPAKKVIVIAVVINIFDIVGNMLGFWQNTLVSRLVLGWLAGLATTTLFSGTFFTTITKHKEEYYGRITTSGTRK